MFNRSKERKARNTLERNAWLTTQCGFFFPPHLPAPPPAFVSRFTAWLASGIRSPRHGRGLAARISRNDQWQALAWNLLRARSSPPEFCSYAKISERSRLKGWFTTSPPFKVQLGRRERFRMSPRYLLRIPESGILGLGIRNTAQGIRNPHNDCNPESKDAIHSSKISGNFGPKLNGSVRSNWKSFEKTGPPFEVDHFSRSDRSGFWLNGSRPKFHWQRIQNPVSRIRNPWRGIQIPRLSWIPLHGAIIWSLVEKLSAFRCKPLPASFRTPVHLSSVFPFHSCPFLPAKRQQ